MLVYWRLFTFQKKVPPLEYLPTSQALQKQQCWHVAPEFLHGVMAETGGCWHGYKSNGYGWQENHQCPIKWWLKIEGQIHFPGEVTLRATWGSNLQSKLIWSLKAWPWVQIKHPRLGAMDPSDFPHDLRFLRFFESTKHPIITFPVLRWDFKHAKIWIDHGRSFGFPGLPHTLKLVIPVTSDLAVRSLSSAQIRTPIIYLLSESVTPTISPSIS